MAYSLADYKSFMEVGQSTTLIDTIQKGNAILASIPFTDNGALMRNKWVYQYSRRITQLTAHTREVGSDYTPTEITAPEDYTVQLAIMGGKYTVDRTMQNAGNKLVQFVAENERQQVEAAQALFNDLCINGDVNNAGEFDGLDVALAGTSTEYNALEVLDLSSQSAIETNAKKFRLAFNVWRRTLKRKPDALIVADAFFPLLTEIAKELALYSETVDAVGNEITRYDNIPFIACGQKSGVSTEIIPTETRTVSAVSYDGLTDMYAVCYGPQEFHGVSPEDKSMLIKAVPPTFGADATANGSVEMVATVVLEDTRAAGVFRNIQIA